VETAHVIQVPELQRVSEIDQYDFDLPRELIAQFPLACRSDARLLVVDRANGTLEHAHIRDLPGYLSPADCLVVNDTRVVPARLLGHRTSTGGRWTGLYLDHDDQGVWRILSKTRGKLQAGESITLEDRHARPGITLTLLAPLEGGMWAARPEASGTAEEILEDMGRVPIPPYIRGGQMVDADVTSYQTVYADRAGAVAAPTAGLHFTPELLQTIGDAGTSISRITLHVGVGTFRPVTADRLDEHDMHFEWGQVDQQTVATISEKQQQGGRVVAVGTTVVRVLETAAASGALQPWEGETNLFIKPGYAFRAVDGLLTNFHLPKSTLLVLVRTFGGDELIQRAYAVAVEEGYRFYSYGDAMLII